MAEFRFTKTFHLSQIADIAREFPNGGRICLHPQGSKQFQLMVIYAPPGSNYPTHRHTDVDESYLVLAGELLVTYLTDDSITNSTEHRIRIGHSSPYGAYLLMRKGTWHSIKSDTVTGATFIEFKGGEWRPDKTEFV